MMPLNSKSVKIGASHHERTRWPSQYRPSGRGPLQRTPVLDLDPSETEWQAWGLCRREDPELFFPIGSTGPAALQIKAAKAVCRTCPVRDECLAFAMATGQDAGVWGGMSEDERRDLRRNRIRQSHEQQAA